MYKLLNVFAFLLIFESLYSQIKQSDINSSINTKNSFKRYEIGFGLENYSKTQGVNGGNYLYGEFHFQIISRLAVGAKISSDLTPNSFDDAITHVGLRYNSKIGLSKFHQMIGLYYVHNSNKNRINTDFVGLDLSLLTMQLSKHKSYELDFLPLTLLYSLDDNDFSIIYTFVRIKLKF